MKGRAKWTREDNRIRQDRRGEEREDEENALEWARRMLSH